jgi:hypothetical protein
MVDHLHVSPVASPRLGLDILVSYDWSQPPKLESMTLTGVNSLGFVISSEYEIHSCLDNSRRHDLGDGRMYYTYDLVTAACERVGLGFNFNLGTGTYGPLEESRDSTFHQTTPVMTCPPGAATPAAAETSVSLAHSPALSTPDHSQASAWGTILLISAVVLFRKYRRRKRQTRLLFPTGPPAI